MYKLIISPFEIDGVRINDFWYIQSDYMPRKGEIMEKMRIPIADDEKTDDYLIKVKVQSVHHELFDDRSATPIVYAEVIEIKKVEE